MEINPYEDRISDLPDDIMHEIFRFLPIRSAARTIILSQRWKSIFSSIPDLDFTNMDSTQTRRVLDYNVGSSNDMNFINNVFFLRDRNFSIRSLKLKTVRLSSTAFNCLLDYPKPVDIEELEITVTIQDDLDIPWSTINCGYLKVLKLNILCFNYKLIQPAMNVEFKLIHTMTLSKLSFLIFFNDSPTLLNLFTDSLFPCLNKLTLDSCYGVNELNLRCSQLKDLFIKDCCLQRLDIYGLQLETLKVERCFDDNINKKVKIIAPVNKLLNWILSINDVKFISKVKFQGLRTLEICIEYYPFNNYSNFSEISVLFRNSPYLETLTVTINTFYKDSNMMLIDSKDDKYWDDQGLEMNYSLNHLRTVRLEKFLECDKQIDLAMFLLKHGKVLEKMILCIGSDNKRDLVLQRRIESLLMGFSWASSQVKIVFQ